MSKVGSWSTTPGNNNSAPPDGWPEGQAPSTVNDCARQMMADIKTAYTDSQWVDHGMSPTYVNGSSFTVPGNQLNILQVGRQLKLNDSSTIYRSVASASYTVVTTINLNTGTGISSGLSSFGVCVVEATNQPWPAVTSTFAGIAIPAGPLRLKNGNEGSPSVFFDAVDSDTGFYWIADGVLGFATNAQQAARLSQGGFVAVAFTVTSDEATKTDWQPIPDGFVANLANVQAGSYTKLKDGTKACGVAAQDMLPLTPQAVGSADSLLMMNYGPAAMVACVALAREVTALRAELDELKAAR